MPQHPPSDFKKPAVLYHASRDTDIDVFEPRGAGVRHASEGELVFAALDKSFSSIFLHPFGDSKMASGYMNEVPYVLIGDVTGYQASDVGGVIYELPSDTFTFDPELGVGYKEWTSTVPVKPIRKSVYSTTLEAMLDLGVQVYLADMQTLADFRAVQVEGKFALIESLQSENQKLGRNYHPFRTKTVVD